MKNTFSGQMLTDRKNHESEEGQEKFQNRSGIENAPVDQEQLVDRREEEKTDRAKMENIPAEKEQQQLVRSKKKKEKKLKLNKTIKSLILTIYVANVRKKAI
nr:hypothetical protein P5652_22475 [Bacillus subtilis]